ncbi:MAG: MATE family efflux transporter [Gemmatimonadaceae bacterium]|nr:MATE family efflux transporter [Gemmatimonadaceae bacterium]
MTHSATVPPDRPHWWQDVRAAVRGTRHDYTSGSIGRATFLLAIPMVLEMLMESLFALSDVFFVARLGASAVATVGLTESLMVVVYTIAMGLAIGGTALVARRVGEKSPDEAARAAVQVIALGAMVSLTLGVIGVALAPTLLGLMGATPDVLSTGTTFARIMLGGSCTAFLLFVINAVFRGAGDAAISMRVLWLANGINIVLGPLLIFGPGPLPTLGVTGAAIATTTGRGVGVLFALWHLSRGSGHLQVRREHVALDFGIMRRILQMATNATVQVMVGSLTWMVLIRIIAGFGSAAMAGYTIAVRLVMFALLPAWGVSNAAATMVGQSLGSRQPDRAEQAVWTAARYNVVFLGLVGVVFVFLTGPIVGVFTNDPDVSRVAVRGLRLMALGFPLYAFGMVLMQAFNGAGDTKTPTRMNIAVFWLFEIPLAFVLTRSDAIGANGIFMAVLSAYSLLALVAWLMFRRGTWKKQRV